MANMEHVQLVKRGRDHVARWREANPEDNLDLNAAYMSYMRAPQVDISGADVRNSDLMGAVLQRANLSGCFLNPCHLYHANLREANLTKARMNGANLRGADLRGADLSGADLDRAILSDANLTGAKLINTNLSRASLAGADLTGADLTGASFAGASLVRANMTNAICSNSDFFQTQFWSVVMTGADLTNSLFGYSVIQDCDLSEVKGLNQVRHDCPSTVGLDSLFRSHGQIPESFLKGIGLPAAAVGFLETAKGDTSDLGEVFISCIDEDEELAKSLRDDLRAHGVRCWVFSQKVRGNPLVERHSTSDQEEIERWVRSYDKMIVLGSAKSLEVEAVLNDITHAKELQLTSEKWTLFLGATDDALAEPKARFARALAAEHVVFDVRSSDADTYKTEVARLAEALKQEQPASAGIPVSNVSVDQL
ncbi:MAG: pentapeptide repeat-containing protein [SAR202 cluster bacterium]|nr:pentapeptide repeat-containing protein [SAR202 cluster bacterium]